MASGMTNENEPGVARTAFDPAQTGSTAVGAAEAVPSGGARMTSARPEGALAPLVIGVTSHRNIAAHEVDGIRSRVRELFGEARKGAPAIACARRAS